MKSLWLLAFTTVWLALVSPSSADSCAEVVPVIYAGQHYDAGRVAVTAAAEAITLQIYGVNGWQFDNVHVYVGTELEADSKHLAPGKFPYKKSFSNPVSSYTMVVPNIWGCGQTVQIAVHLDMIKTGGAVGGDARQTGWAFGDVEFSSAWGWYFHYEICCPSNPPPCTGPDGQTIPNGGSRTYYLSSSVPCGSTCSSQVRTCTNGVLSGSSYNFPSCAVANCQPCTGPDGTPIPHGGSKRYYTSSTSGCGGQCVFETRTCTDGVLSGSNTFGSCSVSTCRDCTGPGGVLIPHGTSKAFYTSSTVGCGLTCTSETRTCTDGSLSGSASAATCAPVCSDCTQVTPPMSHGSERVFYQSDSVPCGSTCASETRRCTDGSLTGSYTFPACSAAACGCTICNCVGPDGSTMEIGESKLFYQSSSVPCGNSCSSESRTCQADGTVSGSFTATSCTRTPCPCTGPDGASIPHGESKTYYSRASVACGETCSTEQRTCTNGFLSGSFTEVTCTVAQCPCLGPDGSPMNSGDSRTFFQSSSVPCGQTCSSEERTCTNGALSGSYTALTCSVGRCPCTGPDGSMLADGSSETYYQSSNVPCGSTCNSQSRDCTNGVLSGSFTEISCFVDECTPPPPPEPTEPIPPPPTGDICDNPKAFFGEVPSLFNVFVFEDFRCIGSDTEGRLAAGNNIHIENYAVGCRLHTTANCINFGDITCKNLTENGEWVSTVVAGNDIFGLNLEIKEGNLAFGGTYNNDVTANFQRDCDLVQQGNLVDFPAWQNHLLALSDRIAALETTGRTNYNTNSRAVTLQGTNNPELDVFLLPSTFCGSWNPSSFEIINVSPSASIFVNVEGGDLSCGGFSMGENLPNPYDEHHVLFNFNTATQLTFFNIGWRGSVLAPRADIVNPTGSVNGQVFAKSWVSTNPDTCMQQNWEPFEGCIPDYCRNIEPLPYCTTKQTGWNPASCTGVQNPTQCVGQDSYFDCFSYDGLTVGCPEDGRTLTLSTLDAVVAFLPQPAVPNPAPLDGRFLDVGTTSAGAAAGELVSLALALAFDQCKSDSMGICSTFGELYMCDEPNCVAFAGMTLGEIVEVSHQVVGGCQKSTNPRTYTLGQVESCLRAINAAFDGCQRVTDVPGSTSTFGYCQCGESTCDALPIVLRPNDEENTNPEDSNIDAAGSVFVNWWLAVMALCTLAFY